MSIRSTINLVLVLAFLPACGGKSQPGAIPTRKPNAPATLEEAIKTPATWSSEYGSIEIGADGMAELDVQLCAVSQYVDFGVVDLEHCGSYEFKGKLVVHGNALAIAVNNRPDDPVLSAYLDNWGRLHVGHQGHILTLDKDRRGKSMLSSYGSGTWLHVDGDKCTKTYDNSTPGEIGCRWIEKDGRQVLIATPHGHERGLVHIPELGVAVLPEIEQMAYEIE